jgi:two-component system, sensor histidine kinase YesM
MNLITKMLLLIAMLMVPVIVLYMYSNHTSISVVEQQINISNQNRLGHFLSQIESTMEQASKYSNLVTKDPDFIEFASNSATANRYEYSARLERLERKLGLFSLSSEGLSRINLYFPGSKQAVSSLSPINYDEKALEASITTEWALRSTTASGSAERAFTRHFIEPYAGVTDISKASVIVEVDLMEDNIVKLLNTFKSQGNNDPFLYQAPGQFVFNTTADQRMASLLVESYDLAAAGRNKNYDSLVLDDKTYLLYFYTSPKLNWTLVDYVPIGDILAPVTRSQYFFYTTVGLLVLAGVIAALLLYYHVHTPIRWLTESVSRLKRGQFSVRITGKKPNQDFHRLILQFNEMAAQIQHLVETVYLEQLRSKEAMMKQLQSQINPHFLYNSLAYIVSMAKMNRSPSVVSMAYRLADYYKYTMRNDSMTTTLKEEIDFVTSYVDIMNYQLDKIIYEVSLPQEMERMLIPRLIIQPVVENAIVHGLESKLEQGGIRITGERQDAWCCITVEDDGVGMSDMQLAELNERVSRAESSGGESFGLWNVNQRLRYQFGEESGITISHAASGGVKVRLRWRSKETRSEGGDGECSRC